MMFQLKRVCLLTLMQIPPFARSWSSHCRALPAALTIGFTCEDLMNDVCIWRSECRLGEVSMSTQFRTLYSRLTELRTLVRDVTNFTRLAAPICGRKELFSLLCYYRGNTGSSISHFEFVLLWPLHWIITLQMMLEAAFKLVGRYYRIIIIIIPGVYIAWS